MRRTHLLQNRSMICLDFDRFLCVPRFSEWLYPHLFKNSTWELIWHLISLVLSQALSRPQISTDFLNFTQREFEFFQKVHALSSFLD